MQVQTSSVSMILNIFSVTLVILGFPPKQMVIVMESTLTTTLFVEIN
jgi:hypothetical protein